MSAMALRSLHHFWRLSSLVIPHCLPPSVFPNTKLYEDKRREMAPLAIILAMLPRSVAGVRCPPQQSCKFHAVSGRGSVLTAIIIVVLWCRNGTHRRILWTAARGIAGHKERMRQS
jgi:hypothetical protein